MTDILLETATLQADVYIPDGTKGLIIFVHGSGSSRRSPRNRFIAEIFNEADYATILVDLLTPKETDNHISPDITSLAERVINIAKWTKQQPKLKNLSLGLIGSSTGGGIALEAAANQFNLFKTIILRGGRSDLVNHTILSKINVPILFIVGENDEVIQQINRHSAQSIPSKHQITIVPNASHLFEEPGTLEKAANLALEWCKEFL